jgi:membrane-bound lytic murein transglycosylase B
MWLDSLERWWKQTNNPLNAWEAIFRCLSADPPAPIPAWCLPYLAEAARKITDLKWQVAQRRMPHEQAARKVGAALGIVRQGASAFAQVRKDSDAMHHALDAEHEPKKGGDFVTITIGQESISRTTETWAGRTARRIKKDCNVETDHAVKATLRRGRKLIGLDQTS